MPHTGRSWGGPSSGTQCSGPVFSRKSSDDNVSTWGNIPRMNEDYKHTYIHTLLTTVPKTQETLGQYQTS